MPRFHFRPTLSLISICLGSTLACTDDIANTDEVGDSETESGDSTSTDDTTSTSTDTTSSDTETTDTETSESETTDTTDTGTTDTGTTDESTDESTDTTETGGPICGDGMVDPGEQCDDGNDIDDDECANDCTLTAEGFMIELENPAVDLPLVDDAYNGMQGSMSCSTLNVADSGTVVDVTATFGITHTFVGDVTAKLISPDGTVVTMFSRPGMVEQGDNGTGCCGETANLLATSPLRFNDEFMANPESMGGPLGTGETICLDDMICDYMTNPGSAAAGTMADFIGESVTGNWTFCASDSGGGDTGTLVSIGISILAVD
jgi:cysteine-rich repeat protein